MFGLFARKGPFTARVSPSGESIPVKAGDNLLKAALDAGLAWPHNCRVGSCGQCRSRLVSGKIKPLSDFSYVLDGADLDDGMILACQACLRSDVEIEVELDQPPVALSAAKTVSGCIAGSRQLTHDILELRVRLDEPLPHYLAGQYADISVPGVVDQPRSYSFACAPENEAAGHVSFHIRHVPNGRMTGWLHGGNRDGQKVTVSGPYGSFWLRESPAPMLCIAGGSGMAPIKALLEQVSSQGFRRKVTYIFGARTRDDLYCLDEMGAIENRGNGQFHFLPVLSREPESSGWDGLRGRCTEILSLDRFADIRDSHAYLCGPPAMIDSAVQCLTGAGLSEKNIFYDKFLDASHLSAGRA
ncbi:2Fe-2S iron-sulfur cluster binding domain-containing protein [Parasulfuritortus cantonensis]|uniref:2Fe-2S iron-sulfur cluster binding domain-containing protein n=1 Tax=Parasulfuritortus cantonensis TaxID=2528202 RepID=A0A4R1B5V1_9PROT|nr:2Fe-2S iron-sulfur cluster-binding protein [Parasulfuritortus cantonensis]TCJ11907.1 2Fe-2S iron-sulfur cluster binding domain-containing protein [Parasulfuritortus cantonensis]